MLFGIINISHIDIGIKMFGFNYGFRVRDINENQDRKKGAKINIISDNGLGEPECDHEECECEDDMKMRTVVSDTVWKIGCYKINPSTPSGKIWDNFI